MADGKLELGESITITKTIQGFLIEGTGPDFARSAGNTRIVVNQVRAANLISYILTGDSAGLKFHAIRDLLCEAEASERGMTQNR